MSENTSKSKIIGAVKILFGIMLTATAIWGYSPLPCEYFAEFTFISNTLGGILLLIDGVLNLTGKTVPKILYLNVGVGIFLVFLICLATLATPNPFNFGGAFFFLHVINPVVFVLSYIFLCSDNAESTFRHILAVPLLTSAYLIFDYILGNIRGRFVYGFFLPETLPVWMAALIGFVVFIVMMLLGLVLFKMNKKVHKNSDF